MSSHYLIQNEEDINSFIEKTNALHDGYIIAIEYNHGGIKVVDQGYEISPELTRLMIQIMVTSINDAVVELIFENILDWKMTDIQYEFLDSYIFMEKNGWLVWSDDANNKSTYKQNSFYVIAEKIKWRIIS